MKPTRAPFDEPEKAVEHPDPGPQHRADGDLLAGDPLDLRPLERRLDPNRLGGQVLRRLVGEKRGQLVDEPAEIAGRGALVAQKGKLVPNKRMIDFDDGAHAYEV